MEVIALMNALVSQFARTKLQVSRGNASRQAAQAAHLNEAVAQRRHPHVAAAMADRTEAGSGQDLFERTMHRVLTGLITSPP